MKRVISLVVALIMVICMVAACGDAADNNTTPVITTTNNTTSTSATTATTTQATTATTKKPNVPAGPSTAPQDENAPYETVGKGPILWLDFEKDNIKDGVIDNVAGEGLDAIITGKPEYMTSPTGADAIHFGQNKSVFDYLTIKNDDRLNFTVDDEFTIDFWYMLDRSAAGWDNLFSKGSSKNGWYGVWLGQTDAANQGVCWGGDTGNNKIGSLYSKYKWHHITVIQKDRTIYTYLDGKQVGVFAAMDYTSATDFYIGGRNSSDASPNSASQFHGAIDEFKIYDYAWESSNSIKSIYAAQSYTYEYVSADGTQKMTLPYRVYLPTDFNENTNSYPVLYFLHGHGECGTDNKTQLQVFGPNILINDIVEMDNCIIVAPQTICDGATNVYEWVASGSGRPGIHQWDSAAGGLGIRNGALDDIIHTVGMQAAEALIKEFVANKENRVDLNRVYVAGISMGGCATWEILARNPDLFAAAVPLCGSAILSTAELLKDVAILAFHGTGDKTVWTEGTTRMVDAIKAAGGNKIFYTPISENFGHSIWNPSYITKNEDGLTPAQWL
ncbi:MAG: prolyl oligopeptidase family serine peptidase, partial [Clostridia bacterium]|nr:prolyl oligopeptidase family serine peptidase [Clostridia bacterium]